MSETLEVLGSITGTGLLAAALLARERRLRASLMIGGLAIAAALVAGQGRDEEAELLLREAIDALAETDYRNVEPEPMAAYARFLRERGRDDEADVIETRLDALLQPESAARII